VFTSFKASRHRATASASNRKENFEGPGEVRLQG
jgi:hypothetical protein